jgi:hypothetical protein
VQAYIIGLSINEDLKLEKGKEKNSNAVGHFIRSSSYVSLYNSKSTIIHVYYNLPFSTSAVILS